MERHAGKIPLQSFAYELSGAHNLITGQASGKVQRKPITIVKEFGAASPQIIQALIANERLTDVVFEFYWTNPYGQEVLRYTITGTNGSVLNFRLYTGEAPNAGTRSGISAPDELEEVSFFFRGVEIEHVAGGTKVVDGQIR